jgi:hypothetical protein
MAHFPLPAAFLALQNTYDPLPGSGRCLYARSGSDGRSPSTKGDFMGLDMYLTAEVYLMDGPYTGSYRKKAERFDAGYWRKHPDLHGYIVQQFADGEDNCQPIVLNEDRIGQIMDTIKKRALPKITGFFFGESENDDDQIAEDLEIFQKALDWLVAAQPGEWRSIEYQASW